MFLFLFDSLNWILFNFFRFININNQRESSKSNWSHFSFSNLLNNEFLFLKTYQHSSFKIQTNHQFINDNDSKNSDEKCQTFVIFIEQFIRRFWLCFDWNECSFRRLLSHPIYQALALHNFYAQTNRYQYIVLLIDDHRFNWYSSSQ